MIPRTVGEAYGLVLAAVASCPDRGEVLPHAQQPECGCAELTRCRAGKGSVAGRVTTTDCVVCRCQALGITG
jgi:hypothetical protein